MKKIILVFASLGILISNPVFAQWNSSSLYAFNLPGASIYNIVSNLLYWLLAIFGFISVIGFVIAGIMYLTSAGDETKAESAKRAMKYSILGIVVGLSGLVIIRAVEGALRGGTFFLFW
jgi:phosphoglycerol transferase MdoB-like AlkP superfamily enzyme